MATAGCGSDDDEEALSKPEYVKQGNAICDKFNKQIETDFEKILAGITREKDLTAGKARAFMEAATPKFASTIEDLRALEPPEGDQETVDKIYEAADTERAKIEESLEDDDAVRQLVLSSDVTPEFEKQAKAYGLDTCAAE